MEKERKIDLVVRFGLGILSFFVMFAGSMMRLLGSGINNLQLTILSFDELFVESPFKEDSIRIIQNNMQELFWIASLFEMFGSFTVIIGIFMFLYVVSKRIVERQRVSK